MTVKYPAGRSRIASTYTPPELTLPAAPDLVLTEPEDPKIVKKRQNREAAEQIEFMDRVRKCRDADGRALPDRPGAHLIVALANENAAGRGIGVLRWKMGISAGLCDIGIFVPRGDYHGAFIELKQSGGVMSDVRDSQRAWIEDLNRAGYKAAVCFGWFSAWRFTCEYLGWDEAVDI